MSSIALPFDPFGQWEITFHETMAAAARAKRTVSHGSNMIHIAADLWRCAKDFRKLLDIFWGLEHMKSLDAESREKISAVAASVRELLESTNSLMATATKKGLRNRTLTGSSLESIRKTADELLDWVETIELSLDPEMIETLNKAESESRRGEFTRLSL